MLSIDEVNEILNELADEIPDELYNELNGGISLDDATLLSPVAQRGDLYIMGQYHRGGFQGRRITIHYGSLMKAYAHCDRDAMKDELRHILRHEFRHHVESLAGNKDLELEDAEYLQNYLESYFGQEKS